MCSRGIESLTACAARFQIQARRRKSIGSLIRSARLAASCRSMPSVSVWSVIVAALPVGVSVTRDISSLPANLETVACSCDSG